MGYGQVSPCLPSSSSENLTRCSTHLLLWAIFENQHEKAEAGEALSGRRRDDWVQFSLYGVQQVRSRFFLAAKARLINEQLDEHHAVEESTIFPLLEEKGVKMGHNIEQHAAFAPAMMDLINYLTSCLSVDKVEYTAVKHKVRSFRPSRVRTDFASQELINVLIGPVMHHLDEEIATLDPARIATSYSHEESVAMELKVRVLPFATRLRS